MRVTHVITRLIVGGAQENTIASVLGLRQKAEVEVQLLSGPTHGPEGSLESKVAGTGLLTLVPSLTRPVHPWKDVLALRQLVRLFRRQRPDLVHTHSGKAGILGRLAAARAGVPIIVHTIHGPSFGAFQGGAANWLFRAAERQASRVTHQFVSVAEAMTQQYLAAGIGTPGQYSTIRSGFALEPYLVAAQQPHLRTRLGLAPTDFVVGKIARLFKLKGHDDLFTIAPDLVKQDANVKFLLVGDGPWRERFKARAAALGLEGRFIFAGLVTPADVPQYVAAMDVLVHLSAREGLPRSLPQALAAARPVVAYDCDGAKEVCLDNETGFLVPTGDLPRLTDCLLALARDPALRRRLGEQGQALVKSQFSVEKMVDDLYALYRRLAEERLPASRFPHHASP